MCLHLEPLFGVLCMQRGMYMYMYMCMSCYELLCNWVLSEFLDYLCCYVANERIWQKNEAEAFLVDKYLNECANQKMHL